MSKKLLSTQEIFKRFSQIFNFDEEVHTEKELHNVVSKMYHPAPAEPTEQAAPLFECAPTGDEILDKIKDLLVSGKYSDSDGKSYNYRINTSVISFVAELKKRGITDIDSKKYIYDKILLSKDLNNADFEQVSWEYFRREMSRKSTDTQ